MVWVFLVRNGLYACRNGEGGDVMCSADVVELALNRTIAEEHPVVQSVYA